MMEARQSRAPYYIKLHIGDYERDCVELSMLQHGAYYGLMRWYYATGRPIPNEMERIYRRVQAFSNEEKAAVQYILENFFVLDGPMWRHRRIDQELKEWSERSVSAKTSASERWKQKLNENNESADANAMRTQCERNANQNQNQNHLFNKKTEKAENQAVIHREAVDNIDHQHTKSLLDNLKKAVKSGR